MEEARHLSFARAVFEEVWQKARPFDRFLVRHVAPRLIRFMFDSMVDPGVYATIGLPAMSTWKAAPRPPCAGSSATRPPARARRVLLDAGAVRNAVGFSGAWRALCGIRADGEPR